MKYDLSTKVLDFDGSNLPHVEKDEKGNVTLKRDLTFRDVLQQILPNIKETDTGELKSKIYPINLKVFSKNDIVEFSSEQVSLIKERVGIFGFPLFVGRVEEFMEGLPPYDKKKQEKGSEKNDKVVPEESATP